MKKTMLLLIIAAAVLAANTASTPVVPAAAHPSPPPPEEYEFYWDDGIMVSAWTWFTGGNYWAVQFDEEKTDGDEGYVTRVCAMTYAGWPDSTFQGFNMYIFGGPGGDPLWWGHLQFTAGGVYQCIDVEPPQPVPATFFVAAEQIGNYPNCDAIGVDAVAGTHNWTCYQGSWGPVTHYGDFMIRCYWDGEIEEDRVSDATWGSIKALY